MDTLEKFLPKQLSALNGLKVSGHISVSDRLVNELLKEMIQNMGNTSSSSSNMMGNQMNAYFQDIVKSMVLESVPNGVRVSLNVPDDLLNKFADDWKDNTRLQLKMNNGNPLLIEALKHVKTNIKGSSGTMNIEIDLSV